MTDHPRGSSRLKKLMWLAALLLLLVAGPWLILSWIGNQRYERVTAEWDRDFGTPQQLFERYPARQTNQAAHRIERLVADVGIDITPRSFEDGVRPDAERAKEFKALKAVLGDYHVAQLERPGGKPTSAPAELQTWIARRESELLALRQELLAGAQPRWMLEIDKLFATEIPNLLGHIDLQKVITALALHEVSQDRHDEALAWIDAGWRLNRALRDDPILITQLIAVASTRLHAGALRHIEGVPPEWRQRLFEHDYLARALEALHFEGWMVAQIDRPELLDAYGVDGVWESAAFPLVRPYLRLCLADVSGRWHAELDALEQLDYLCDRAHDRPEADLAIEVPSWNRLGEIMIPNLTNVTDRVVRLQLDLELTARVIELKARSDGQRSTDVARLESSEVCPEDRWIYEAEGGEVKSIRFAREISWPDQLGVILPTRYNAQPSS